MASNVDTTTAGDESALQAWFTKNQKPVTYGAVAVAVLLVGGWLFMETGRRKEAAGADALDRARATFESGNWPAASTEFQRVAANFRGTEAGFGAELALNEVRIASGQNQIAADELAKFAAQNPPPFYASGAATMMGTALENLKKYPEAAAAYLKGAELATEDYRKVEAFLGAARAYRLAGKTTEAADVLRGVVSKFKREVPGVSEAEVRLAETTRGAN